MLAAPAITLLLDITIVDAAAFEMAELPTAGGCVWVLDAPDSELDESRDVVVAAAGIEILEK